MENEDLKKMFGKNYKEVTRKSRLEKLLTDEEVKSIFYEIVSEIKTGKVKDDELIEILKNVPEIITNAIVSETYGNDGYELLKKIYEIYYKEFILACDSIDKKGISEFEKRVFNAKVSNFKLFLKERLLTLEELVFIIEQFAKHFGGQYTYIYFFTEKETDNKYEEVLYKVHKLMNSTKRIAERDEILKTTKKELLEDVLKKVKLCNKVDGLTQ